ncbi:MAG: hypothetical protein F6J90_30405 [Moorea sp. SIOASIH]|uniref:hypothetical protein n=1 Tax=Moorena sp. SIOASIH TaxID=2607817 RepID=UPI0013B985D3|nr:hypothetical protein [Moorena sp. SIOASIH]NEO40421.1 hypothetical protein [Moorena sp. SIOASIH]
MQRGLALLSTPYSLLPAPKSLLPTPCSEVPTPYSLLPAPCYNPQQLCLFPNYCKSSNTAFGESLSLNQTT